MKEDRRRKVLFLSAKNKGWRGVTEHNGFPYHFLNSNLRIKQTRPVSSPSHMFLVGKNNPIDIFVGIKNNPWGKWS